MTIANVWMMALVSMTLEVMAEVPTKARAAGESPGVSAFREWLATPEVERKTDASALRMPLSKDEAAAVIGMLCVDRRGRLVVERTSEVDGKSLVLGDKTLRWLEKTCGRKPVDGRSLWISLHGGGAVPQAINDQQWMNQARLYDLAEGIYIAPRAPTDTWNLWHEEHIDVMLQRLIEDFVAVRGVNPDKIYLMGYSAGGDGVWQLAPRMADRFAAAAMMAGHPNDASQEGLRNLPFAIFMGGNDGAYERNEVAAEKVAELDRLERADPGGYVHMARIYDGLGHWMNGRDAEALPWMSKFRRNPWPRKIVWVQDDVLHDRFYWLKISDKAVTKENRKIHVTVDAQRINLTGDVTTGMKLLLSDALLDLDEPVSVTVNDRLVSTARIPRTAAAIRQSLEERFDASAVATAILVLP